MSFVRRHAPLLVPYVVLAILLRAWLMPGLIAGEDFRAIGWADQPMLQHYFPWPESWDPSFDIGIPMDASTLYPLLMIAGILTHLGVGWNVIERLLFLFPLMLILPLTSYALCYSLTDSPWAAACGAMLFALNPWTVTRIEYGHIPSLVAYGLMPLLVILLARNEVTSLRNAFGLGLILLGISAYDVRYAYISGLIVAIVFAAALVFRPGTRMRVVASAGLLAVTTVLGSLYWLVPTFLAKVTLPASLFTIDQFVDSSSHQDILHAFALFDPFYHHIEATDGFAAFPTEWPFVLVGIAAAGGLCLGLRDSRIRLITGIWLAGLILESGPTSAFASLNQFLFVHVPGMEAFRDSSKFFSLCNVGAGAGLALFVQRVRDVTGRFSRLPLTTLSAACSALVLIAYIVTMRDAFNPERLSNFAPIRPQPSNASIARSLALAHPSRVLFFPDIPLGYRFGADHPAIIGAELALSDWPDGIGAIYSAEGGLLSIYRSPRAHAMLCELGIRYLSVIGDPTGQFYTPWEYGIQRTETLPVFERIAWLREIDMGAVEDRGSTLFKVTGCSGRADRMGFMARRPVVFVGNPSYMGALAQTPFWDRDPAVVILSEQRSLAALKAIGNVVLAPSVISPEAALDYALPLKKESALLASAVQRLDRTEPKYRGIAFDSVAEAADLGQPVPPGIIVERFRAPSTRATIQLRATASDDYHYERAAASRLRPRAESWYEAISGMDVPLKAHPRLEVECDPEGFAIIAVHVSAGTSNRAYDLSCPPGSTYYRVDIADAVQEAIDAERNGQRAAHFLDYAWLETDAYRLREESTAFALRSVWIRNESANQGVSGIKALSVVTAPYGAQRFLQRLDLRSASVTSRCPLDVRARADVLRASVIDDRARDCAAASAKFFVTIPWQAKPSATALELQTTQDVSAVALVLEHGRRIAVTAPVDSLDLAGPVTSELRPDVPRVEPLDVGLPIYGPSLRPVPQSTLYRVYVREAATTAHVPASQVAAVRFEFDGPIGGDGSARISFASRILARGVRRRATPPLLALDGRSISGADHIWLSAGEHTIADARGEEALSGLISMGRPVSYVATDVVEDPTKNFSERSGMLSTGGGLFVMPSEYDDSWHLALAPSTVHLTGNPLKDYLDVRKYFVAPDEHVRVNGGLNGWIVPPFHGRIVAIYDKTFLTTAGMLAEAGIVVFAALVFSLSRLVRRPT